MGVASQSTMEAWGALASAAAEANPFYHPALLMPALDEFARERPVTVLEARHNGQLIGMMPVIRKARHGRIPIANCSNWLHEQCFFGAPLLRAGDERAAWAELLGQLDRAPWSGAFLHLEGVDPDGPVVRALVAQCAGERRGIVGIAQHERAMVRSDLDFDAYWRTHVGAKKRKELRRQHNRLADFGTVDHRHWSAGEDVGRWTADFLALESSGWKGEAGTALGSDPATRHWFSRAMAEAASAGMLDMLRIDVAGRPIAMLVNFRLGRVGFSFKIAYDEAYARQSPGLLIEMDNLRAVLDGDAYDWMDSCAAPDHPMIDGIWGERRRIGQFRVALKGLRQRALFAGVGIAERLARVARRKR